MFEFSIVKNILCFFSDNLPLTIAILALLFSVISFWWTHWRRGKIIVSFPVKFGINYTKSNSKLIIELPLVFYNTGAATIIINNLRLNILDANNQIKYLHFNNTFDDLENNNGRQWGFSFSIEGRKTFSKVFVFMKTGIQFKIPDDKIDYNLELQKNNKYSWVSILKGKLETPKLHHKTMYEILRCYNNY